MKFRWLEILVHLLFWLLSLWLLNQSFAFESIEIHVDNGVEREIYKKNYALFPFFVISLLAKMVLVYGNIFWTFPRFLRTKEWLRFALELLTLLIIVLSLELVLLLSYDFLVISEHEVFPFFFSLIKLNALFYLFYFGGSVAYSLGKDWWRNEQLKEKLLQEKLKTELDFLKSQVNPHFLFNTLNNLFSIAERDDHGELSAGIAELANLMRYMLYDCQANRVSIEKEITLLNSIIEIHSLRIAEEDQVVLAFEVDGDYIGKRIAPLLLVPFVENAFKHGIGLEGGNFIKIKLSVRDAILHFEVRNSMGNSPMNELEMHSGIGLENVKRRLELTYPGKYQLDFGQEGEIFAVNLMIELD